MICPNCHSENRDDSRFCQHCGASIHPDTKTKPPAFEAGKEKEKQPSIPTPDQVKPEQPPVIKPKTCPCCGQENDFQADYCIQCGTSLKEKEQNKSEKPEGLVCPLCGHENKAEDEYCTECGASLKQNAKAAPPVTSAFQNATRKEAASDQNKKKIAIFATAGALLAAVVIGAFFLFNHNSDSLQSDRTVQNVPKESQQEEKEEEAEVQEPKERYTIIREDLPAFSSRPVYVGNGHYIYQSEGKYGVIDSSGDIQASGYDAYALRELSRPEKEMVDFVGYACVYNEPSQTGIDAIELQPCDKNAVFPWVQEYAPRVIGADDTVKDFGSGTSQSDNSSLYRQWQKEMAYTIVDEATYQSAGSQDLVPYYIFSEATQTLFGPYEAGEHAFFELKPRLVKNNYSCDSIFYNHEEGKYRIYNANGTESYPDLFDYAEPVSDDYMLVKSGDKTGLLDADFNLTWVEGAEDLTGADGNRTYALMDGAWKLIEFTSAQGEDETKSTENNSDQSAEGKGSKAGENSQSNESSQSSAPVVDAQSLFEGFLQQQGYLNDTAGASQLSYYIGDLNGDGTVEMLIQTETDRSFYTTWTYVVKDGQVQLVDQRYGYGMFRLSQDGQYVLTSPEVRPNRNTAIVPFDKLGSDGYTNAYSIGIDLGNYYYWGLDNQPVPLSEADYYAYLGTPIMLDFIPLT